MIFLPFTRISPFLNALNIRDLGLFKGKIGIVVFLYNYYRYVDKKIYKIFADELLKDLYDEISSNSTVNFESGLSFRMSFSDTITKPHCSK